jgi:hypothetical protein
MGRYGFMRTLIGLNRYMIVDESILSIGIDGISGQVKSVSHKKESSERHNRTGKRNHQTEAISSEGNC